MNLKLIKYYFFYFLIFLCSGISKAQQKDAVFWGGVNFEKKLSKRFSVSLFNQYALNQNLAELGYYFFDVGINFKYNDHVSLSGNYRLSEIRNLDNFYNDRQVLYGDLSYSKGFGNFSFALRTRYQQSYYGLSFTESENYKRNKNFSRNKITIKYKLNRIYSFYISGEQYYRWNNKNRTEAWRSGIGVYYQFNLYNRIELYYLIQQQVNLKNPQTDYISGITYYYKF